jgi:TetR/AcrR family transcriptional regulator
MKNKKLTRREREKLWQRQEMLTAALDLFSEKGYQNVSMREIAERAEFAVGTLYKFFQSKEDLYKALVLEQCDKFEDVLVREVEKPGDEVEKLRNYVWTKGELFRNNLPFIRLFLAESKGASFNIKAGLDKEVRKRYYRFLERLASIFEIGIKNKRFKTIAAPYHLAVALDSVVDSFLLLWLEAPESHAYPDNPDIILHIFFKGLIAK